MNDRDVIELFTTTGSGKEPALSDSFAEVTLVRARRSVRLRRAAGSAGAVALVVVLVMLLGVAPWPGHTSNQSTADSTGPSLPDQFPELSRFTSRAVDRPAGRAIALYEYGDPDGPWQMLVASADRDAYRRVDVDADATPAVLLSADGRYVMYFKASKDTDEFRLLDLTTGWSQVRHSVEWMSNVGGTITMLAWSPDGRYLAYAVPHPSPNDGRAESSLRNGIPLRDLAILDVANDTNVLVSLNVPILGAAFSPDSQRVAVFGDSESPIVSVRGEQVGTWSAPTVSGSNMEGMTTLAWSPDGTRLAVGLPPLGVPVGVGSVYYGPATAPIVFVDLTGTNADVRTDLTGYLLGWRSPTSVVVAMSENGDRTHGDNGVQALLELSIVDGSRTVLSRFPPAGRCTLTGRCTAYRVQAAPNLLRQAGIRPSDPDRGPWLALVHVASAVVPIVVVTAAILIVLRRRRVRRRGGEEERAA